MTNKATIERMNTTIRLNPDDLMRLKVIAAIQRVSVNDLLLEGVEFIFAKYKGSTKLRVR